MTGLILIQERSFVKPSLWVIQPIDESGKVDQCIHGEDGVGNDGTGCWRGPVGPLKRDSHRAALGVADDQRLDTGDATALQDAEALPAERMKRMGNRDPSQTRIGLKGSSLGPSECR